jgi:hypothetical protein
MQECQETVFDCGLFEFMNTREATCLRACNRVARRAVARHAWADMETRIHNVRCWNACFPHATKANLSHHGKFAHHEFNYVENITHLDLSYCESYSFINKSFAYLQGLRYLDMSHSWQDRTVWAFFREAFDDRLFRYLGKLEILKLDGYGVNQFSGAFTSYLPNLKQLFVRDWVHGPEDRTSFFKNTKAKIYVTNPCSWAFENWSEIPRNEVYLT